MAKGFLSQLSCSCFALSQETFPRWNAVDMATQVPGLCADGLDLLVKTLTYEPSQRISAKTALRHPYFAGVSA